MFAAFTLIAAFPPMWPPILLKMAAIKLFVEILAAATLIVAFEPMIPPRPSGPLLRISKIALT